MSHRFQPVTFGDPPDFAIEAGVELPPEQMTSVWGRMRVWCAGHPIGHITDPHWALYPAFLEFDRCRADLDALWDDSFETLNDRALFTLFDRLLFKDDARSLEQMHRDERRFGHHTFLTNWGEQFDGWKAFLLAPPGRPLKVLSCEHLTATHLAVEVSRPAFQSAASECVEWFQDQERHLSKS